MCDNPIYRAYTDYCGITRYVPCPCCKCPSCLKDHRNSWMIRLFEESKNWRYIRFVTLTYSDESLPCVINGDTGELVSTVLISDVSSAIKRFRTAYYRTYGYIADFKYFCCSEYGPNNTKRPHYHCLFFFNFDPRRFGLFLDDWRSRFGYVLDKPVRSSIDDKVKISRYVSKYIVKGGLCSRADDVLNGVIYRPSFIMSKGIGVSYVSRMYSYHRDCEVHEMVNRMYYTFDGKVRYPLPKFYKDRFYRKLKSKIKYEVIYNEDFTACSFSYVRTVKRYTSESLLSVAIADIVRARRVSDFYKSVRFEESRGLTRPQAIAKARLLFIDRQLSISDSNATALADEMRSKFFSDRHSEIST